MKGTPEGLPRLSVEKTMSYLRYLGVHMQESNDETLPAPTLQLLSEIQQKHTWKIPFESVSVHVLRDTQSVTDSDPIPYQQNLGKTLIGPDDLFDKIVTRGHGGYCFELNGLLSMVLRTLQYEITNMGARVYIHQNHEPQDAGWAWYSKSHQCTVVRVDDQRYHVDVGFGSGQPELPILLRSETA